MISNRCTMFVGVFILQLHVLTWHRMDVGAIPKMEEPKSKGSSD